MNILLRLLMEACHVERDDFLWNAEKYFFKPNRIVQCEICFGRR